MYSNLLPIATAINPRELGGLTGFNNRKIQMHRLLRTCLLYTSDAADD